MLGVGLYGNRKTQPRWSVEELAPKLLKATLGDSAATMRKKAQGFAKNFQERPEGIGRDYAARFILDRITQ